MSAAPRMVAARMDSCLIARRAVGNDRQLRGFDVERLVVTGAAVLILGRDREPNNAGRRVLRHDPFRDPEGALRLLRGRAPAHRDVLRLTRVSDVHDELRVGFRMLAGLWIDRLDAPAY